MISIEKQGDNLILLKGSVSHSETIKCKELLSDCLSSEIDKEIQVDIAELESVSSVTLSFLLFGLRAAKLQSCEIHYKNMPPALFNMARVSGIESILVS